MKTAAILQSNYVPWKGYFDIIDSVDEFIIYDDVQFTKNDWRNRNVLKTGSGPLWLTIPVLHSFGQLIDETKVADQHWRKKHWGTVRVNYLKTPGFPLYEERLKRLWLDSNEVLLGKINRAFIDEICAILGIKTRVSWSTDYPKIEGKTERLVALCKEVGATRYLSGPAAKDYLDVSKFTIEGMTVDWMDYSGYPEYRQLHPPFDHRVSVLDLLFNEGEDAKKYFKRQPPAGGQAGVSMRTATTESRNS